MGGHSPARGGLWAWAVKEPQMQEHGCPSHGTPELEGT